MSGTSTILIKAVRSHDVGAQAGAVRGLLAPLLSFIFIPTSHRLCLKLWTLTSNALQNGWEQWHAGAVMGREAACVEGLN